MTKYLTALVVLVVVAVLGFFYVRYYKEQTISDSSDSLNQTESGEFNGQLNSLSVDSLKNGTYDGSDFKFERTLDRGSNYQRFIVSYSSEGFKIYALLTVPEGEKPAAGWPSIIFNHGYIPPKEYTTTGKYIAYTDAFSKNGYLVLKPDFRGHGQSEGEATGGYGSNAYTIDVLNALASVKRYPAADPNKIGMWGHSMGGHITLRSMVVNSEIKAGVIWAGVVGSYPDLLNNWRRSNFTPPPLPTGARRWRQQLIEDYGPPEQNPAFWDSISSTHFISEISGPLQLHHGTADESVPIEFSQKLNELMKVNGKESELYVYDGDDHNLSRNLSLALARSVQFFDSKLK